MYFIIYKNFRGKSFEILNNIAHAIYRVVFTDPVLYATLSIVVVQVILVLQETMMIIG